VPPTDRSELADSDRYRIVRHRRGSPRHTGAVLPPWEWPGLPDYLTIDDFSVVERVASSAPAAVAPSGTEFVRATGVWARWANAAGSSYDHNQLRIKRVLGHPPLHTQTADGVVYPVVFVPDPFRTAGSSTVPVGACSIEGYVGSAWGAFTNDWARLVSEGMEQQRFYVSQVRLFPGRYEAFVDAEICLPMPEAYRQRQERSGRWS